MAWYLRTSLWTILGGLVLFFSSFHSGDILFLVFELALLMSVSLFICFSVTLGVNDLGGRADPFLSVMSAGHALHVFVNGQLQGKILTCTDLTLPFLPFLPSFKGQIHYYFRLGLWLLGETTIVIQPEGAHESWREQDIFTKCCSRTSG